MNVLIYYSSPIVPNTGGVQNVAFSVANYLISKGYNIYFLSIERLSTENPNYFILPNNQKINSASNSQFTLDLLSHYSIDVILNLDGLNLNVLRFLIKFKKGVKIFNVIHNTFLPQNIFFNKYLKQYFKIFYLLVYYFFKQPYYLILDLCSDKIILFSEKNMNDIKYLGNSIKFRNKIYFIPNPINISGDCSSFIKENAFVFVGRLDDNHKNLIYLLNIWDKLCHNHINWKLNILGAGKDFELIKNYSNKIGLINVYFLGNIDPTNYYKTSKYLLLTSRFEGWPMVIPEAMNYGCIPCVVNSFTSLKDIVVDGVNGYYLDEFNLNKNVHILETLINNVDMTSIEHNCIKTSKEYSIDYIGLKWIHLLSF